MKVHVNPEDRKIKFVPDPGVRELLAGYIARQNVAQAPAKLTITAVMNDAIREYVDRREGARANGVDRELVTA